MRFMFSLGLAAVGVVAFALPASSHHSHGNYVVEDFVDLEGIVKEIHLVNPHSWVYMEVKGETEEPQVWVVEATGRTELEGIGITRDYVKVGDPIKVRCHPLRDGSSGCLMGYLKAKDGSVKDWDASDAPPPADF